MGKLREFGREFLIGFIAILVPFAFGLTTFLIITIGIIGLPLNFEVDPEFINGVLTANSIVFGFWATLIGLFSEEKIGGIRRKLIIRVGIIGNLIIFSTSVIAVFFSGLGKPISIFAFGAVTTSFLSNVWLLAIVLYFFSTSQKPKSQPEDKERKTDAKTIDSEETESEKLKREFENRAT